jgi:hypothetical protein
MAARIYQSAPSTTARRFYQVWLSSRYPPFWLVPSHVRPHLTNSPYPLIHTTTIHHVSKELQQSSGLQGQHQASIVPPRFPFPQLPNPITNWCTYSWSSFPTSLFRQVAKITHTKSPPRKVGRRSFWLLTWWPPAYLPASYCSTAGGNYPYSLLLHGAKLPAWPRRRVSDVVIRFCCGLVGNFCHPSTAPHACVVFECKRSGTGIVNVLMYR